MPNTRSPLDAQLAIAQTPLSPDELAALTDARTPAELRTEADRIKHDHRFVFAAIWWVRLHVTADLLDTREVAA